MSAEQWVVIEDFGEDGIGDVVGPFQTRAHAEDYAATKKGVWSGWFIKEVASPADAGGGDHE